jgi:hypothetical protein
MLRYLFGWLMLSIPVFMLAQTGCPGCLINLPDLAADTIFITAAPDGEAGSYYDEDLSFRLPMSTTPVNATDPTIPAGLPIDEISIVAVAGLPPGLSWEANQLDFDVSNQTDGCVKFCGTPLIAGVDTIEVVLETRIAFIVQQSTVSIPILIHPAQSISEGFSLLNNSGCGSVTTSFTNNIPSGGVEGFSYLWFFGNGNATTAENPDDQLFTQPGVYSVDYQAIVDTAGFFMTEVVIEATSCDDIFSNPDLKFDLFDPEGNQLFTAPIVGNATLPITFQVFIPIEEGIYELHVIDDDGGIDLGDDLCGIIPFSQENFGSLSDGDLMVNINLINPIDTIISSDTIIVYPIPNQPLLNIVSDPPYCDGEEVELLVGNYDDSMVWYRDSNLVVDANAGNLMTSIAGDYWVTYTSPDGCEATSLPFELLFTDNPAAFELQQNENLLRMVDESNLPADFTFIWSYEGEPIPSATTLLLCAEVAGEYSLTIIDSNTGCSTTATIDATYNPGISCTTPVDDLGAVLVWRLFPNPVQSLLYLDGPASEELSIRIFDAYGRLLREEQISYAQHTMNLNELPAGMYFYKLLNAKNRVKQSGSFIKTNH